MPYVQDGSRTSNTSALTSWTTRINLYHAIEQLKTGITATKKATKKKNMSENLLSTDLMAKLSDRQRKHGLNMFGFLPVPDELKLVCYSFTEHCRIIRVLDHRIHQLFFHRDDT